MLIDAESMLQFLYFFTVVFVSISTFRDVSTFRAKFAHHTRIGIKSFFLALLLPKRIGAVSKGIIQFQKSKIEKVAQVFGFEESGAFNKSSYQICLTLALIYPTFFLLFFFVLYGAAQTDLVYVGFDPTLSDLDRTFVGVLIVIGMILSIVANFSGSILARHSRNSAHGSKRASSSKLVFWTLNLASLVCGGVAGYIALDLYFDHTGIGSIMCGVGAILIVTVTFWSPRFAIVFALIVAIGNSGVVNFINYEVTVAMFCIGAGGVIALAYRDRQNEKARNTIVIALIALLVPFIFMAISSAYSSSPESWSTWGTVYAFVVFPITNSFFDWLSVNSNYVLAKRGVSGKAIDEATAITLSFLLPCILSILLVAALTIYLLLTSRILLNSYDSGFNFRSAFDEPTSSGFYWIYASIVTNFIPAIYRIYVFSVERVLVTSLLNHKSITLLATIGVSILIPLLILEIEGIMERLHIVLSWVFYELTYFVWGLISPN